MCDLLRLKWQSFQFIWQHLYAFSWQEIKHNFFLAYSSKFLQNAVDLSVKIPPLSGDITQRYFVVALAQIYVEIYTFSSAVKLKNTAAGKISSKTSVSSVSLNLCCVCSLILCWVQSVVGLTIVLLLHRKERMYAERNCRLQDNGLYRPGSRAEGVSIGDVTVRDKSGTERTQQR